MRKQIYVIILSMVIFFGLPAIANDIGVIASRGFQNGACFKQLGKLSCENNLPCLLEIFSGANKLVFKTNLQDKQKVFPKNLRGRFQFKYAKAKDESIAVIQSFTQFKDQTSDDLDDYGLAKRTPCTL